jgi:hypothetical protein
MRTITDHRLTGLNEAISIVAMDERGHGGANHHYNLTLDHGDGTAHGYEIKFQKGPIKEAGVNGLSGEALLAVEIDRLRGFQSGPFACDDNARALLCCEMALYWLQKRTRERVARGVEGALVK